MLAMRRSPQVRSAAVLQPAAAPLNWADAVGEQNSRKDVTCRPTPPTDQLLSGSLGLLLGLLLPRWHRGRRDVMP